MTKGKDSQYNGQQNKDKTMIYKILQKKLYIKKHEPHKKRLN